VSVLIGLSTRMDRRLLEPSGDPALEDRDEKHDGAEPRLNSRCVLVRVRDLPTLAPRSPLPKLSFACEAFLAVSVHPPAASEVGTVAVDFTAAAAAGSGAAGPAAANSGTAGTAGTADLGFVHAVGVAAPEVDSRVGLVAARGVQVWRRPQAACGELWRGVSANVAHGACGCCMCRRYRSRLVALGNDDDDDDEFDLVRQEASPPHMLAQALESVCEAP